MLGSDAASEYERDKTRFELRHFTTETGKTKFHTIIERSDHVGLYSQTKAAFTVAYEDWTQNGRRFLNRWYADPCRRSYERIEYGYAKPEEHAPSVYYAFPKMRHETLPPSDPENKQANVDFFLEYIGLLTGGAAEGAEWMLAWLAGVLVNAHDERPVAVVLRGASGSGKSSLLALMGRVLGALLVHRTCDPLARGDVLHPKNTALLFKLLVELEDPIMPSARAIERVRALISDRVHSINAQHTGPILVRASARVLVTTSRQSLLAEAIAPDAVTFSVSARRARDTAYWNLFYTKLDDAGYVKDVSEFLLSCYRVARSPRTKPEAR
jgi:hypothetical protein